MSRPSVASLTMVAGSVDQRPDPPADLTASQADIWRATVASESVDFFRTTALRELLKDYCRHKASGAHLSARINRYEENPEDAPDVAATLDALLKMRERETKAAADKATKLRLTNQSRYTPLSAATAAKHASVQKKPWEPRDSRLA